jgi:hypothetical protein
MSRLLVLLLALLASVPALAHTRSETQSVWRVVGSTVRVAYTIPDIELPRLARPDGTPASDAELTSYVREHLSVLQDGEACERTEDVRPVAATPSFHRYEFAFVCKSPEGIAIQSSAFFDIVPTHVTYAQVITDSGDFISQILTPDQQTLELSSASGEAPLQSAGFLTYVLMGIDHIYTGYDHQAFILALVLLSSRLRDLLFVITGFTIGHSISLSLAVTGLLRPHAEYIDSLVGLTIALIAAENIADAAKRRGTVALVFGGLMAAFAIAHGAFGLPGLPFYLVLGAAIFAANYMMLAGFMKDAARLRLVVTLVFGTIHGFSFAANLLEMRLPSGRLAELLIGFNIGVEIGQLLVVGIILSIIAVLTRINLTLPRAVTVDVMSAVLVGLGLYWFVSRGYALIV